MWRIKQSFLFALMNSWGRLDLQDYSFGPTIVEDYRPVCPEANTLRKLVIHFVSVTPHHQATKVIN